ncbi:MAG TPA: molybdate ABC transporter permease subunit, partial [Gammaproteobacteria bacterium]|nr:molybdate ABC transporter permease subunit [Gammaproteobacteria bacterium]
MMSSSDLAALFITLKLAAVATSILLLFGTPFAWWLARTRWRFRFLLEAVVALPLVLPPTVLGFYLLVALGPQGPVGGVLEALGGHAIAFTFSGLVVGSILYSLPFVIQPLQNVFSAIDERTLEAASTLRA